MSLLSRLKKLITLPPNKALQSIQLLFLLTASLKHSNHTETKTSDETQQSTLTCRILLKPFQQGQVGEERSLSEREQPFGLHFINCPDS